MSHTPELLRVLHDRVLTSAARIEALERMRETLEAIVHEMNVFGNVGGSLIDEARAALKEDL